MEHSIIIVGAGPGGAAAAVRLGQRGIKNVLLLDRDDFPRAKTCGSGLSPNALKVIDELGIGAEVRQQGYPIHSLILTTPGRRQIQLRTEQAATILLREQFDNLLVERAKHLGIEFRGGMKAQALLREGGRVVGVRAGGEELRSKHVLCADGAHSIFSWDPRPKRTISALMGWWENFAFEPGTLEMIFDKNLSPLYGWLFPETADRVNIGICMDGEDASGNKTTRNVRQVFDRFLDDHFADRLIKARQIGKLKGHPISYCTWIKDATTPGAIYLGEGARITHNTTGEGIFQAMLSGTYAGDAAADVVDGKLTERAAWQGFEWRCRKRFTLGFIGGHALRWALKTPLLDGIATAYNSPLKQAITWAIASSLAGSTMTEQKARPRNRSSPSPSPTRSTTTQIDHVITST